MTKPHHLCLLIILLVLDQTTSSSNVTLTYSSKSSKVVIPSNPRPVQYVVYKYPSKIKQVPEAEWIWSGFGNEIDCPMTITIQDNVSVTCLMQPITLYASADNFFTATFFGQSFSGNSWSAPVSKSINPKGKTCSNYSIYLDGTYHFSITATNEPDVNQKNCSGGNWAAVIYGVVQQRPDICCDTTAQYYNASTCECYPCKNLFDVGCTNCTISSCTKCNATANFVSSGTKCQCKSDMYHLNVSQCILCNNFLDNCTNCNDQNTCTKCQVGYKLNPTTHKCQKCQLGCLSCDYNECFICDTSKQFQLLNLSCVCNQTSGLDIDQCKLCSVMIQNCTSCVNGTFCTHCEQRSMLNHDSTLCELCPIGCSSCQYSVGCITCDNGYYLNFDNLKVICISHCGDGIYLSSQNEECDDGNIVNGDGCSENCVVQGNYTCDNQERQLSNCSYSGAFRLFVKWVKKEYYLNKLNISLGIRPHINNLNYLNFLEAFQRDNSFIDQQCLYDSNGSLYLSYFYNRSLEGQHILFTFAPAQASFIFKHTPTSSILIQMTTNSNIPITYYQQYQYQSAQIVEKIFSYCIFFSYFIMFGSLFINEIASLELFFLWQVSFFSLGVVDKVNPVFSGIFWIRKVNGYNWVEPSDNRFVNDRINAINYSGDIYQNLNLNFVILAAVTVLTLLIKLLFWFIKGKSVNKLRIMLMKFFSLGSFYFVVYSIMNVGFSCGLQILYGQFNTVNTVIFIFSIILPLITFKLLIFSNSHQYQQFFSLFKQQLQSQLYFSFNLIYRFSLGFALSLYNQSTFIPIYTIFLSVSYLVYQLSVRPFKNGYQNYVSVLNQCTIVIIVGIRMFYRSMKNQYPLSIISKILEPGYIQIALIILNILLVLTLLIYEITVKFKTRKRVIQQEIKKIRKHRRRKSTLETNVQIEDGYQSKDEQVQVYII